MATWDEASATEKEPNGRSPDAVLQRAKRRYKVCQDWESTAHNRAAEDMKFLFGDPDNGWQWDESMRRRRLFDKRPCLTINKTHIHWLSVVNDGKAQKPSISIHPVSNGATYEAAQAFEDVIRHIEYTSNAQTAYDRALEWQVGCGIGYWRVETRYVDDNAFDQEIIITEVDDPLSIYVDPDIKKQDGSDMNYAFVFKEMPAPEFDRKYPGQEAAAAPQMGDTGLTWLKPGYVRVAEYFEVVEKKDVMFGFHAPDGSIRTMLKSQMSDQDVQNIALLEQRGDQVQRRPIKRREVWWYLIAGDEIIDRKRWPGKYIPIVRCVGEETTLDGRLDRKGLVRYMKDAQRQFNYNASAQVEFVALQGKTPWIASMQSVAGYEQYYKTANHINHSWMPYNAIDDDGNPLPKPERAQPPVFSQAYEAGMEAAAEQMKMSSGQQDALMGAPSNETSGIAIDKRTRQSERTTYHFVDGQAKAVQFTGKILIDLIPKVYDTARLLRIRGENGDERHIKIDPQAAMGIQVGDDGLAKILNPTVGVFDVVADVGPDFSTRRQEAFNAFREILARNPELTQVAGDLMFRAADFPMADELAKRLENWIPPNIRGEGPSPAEQQLQAQLQQAMQKIQELTVQLRDKSESFDIQREKNQISFLDHAAKRIDVSHQKEIDAFRAITERLKATGVISPEVDVDAVLDALGDPLAGVEHGAMGTGSPMPGLTPFVENRPPIRRLNS
ncbi:portal protein [Burkholderia orbicola]|uniref:portal protein n=1 Tax=Burkholderia orbicola TaxID=2978683 RepID=UPI00264F9DF3|nr:portal protein [Burkholderia orbicola]MDN7558215.1 portal protein [Burkholderia orbicola]